MQLAYDNRSLSEGAYMDQHTLEADDRTIILEEISERERMSPAFNEEISFYDDEASIEYVSDLVSALEHPGERQEHYGWESVISGLAENDEAAVGGSAILLAGAAIATPLCAWGGSYLGEGVGWLLGNGVDFVPYARDVAPWMVDRAGMLGEGMTKSQVNEDLYQASGAKGGFWGGFWLPWQVLLSGSD